MSAAERFLVTGALGCIGAWTLRRARRPFPEEFDGSALEEAIGPIGWTPLAGGVRQTIETLRAAQG